MAYEFSPDLADGAGNQRRFKRFAVTLPALISREPFHSPRPEAANPPGARRVIIVNMSLTGLYFVSPEFFPIGTPLWIQFPLGETTFSLEILLRRMQEEEFSQRICYTCGAQFVRNSAIAAALPVIADFLLSSGRKPPKPLSLVSESVAKQPPSPADILSVPAQLM